MEFLINLPNYKDINSVLANNNFIFIMDGDCLVRIVVLGKSSDNAVSLALVRALQKYGCVEYLSENKIFRTSGTSPNFIVYDTDKITKIDATDTILIFKRSFDADFSVSLSAKCTAILEQENIAAKTVLMNHPATAIFCGMSSKDSITLASNDIQSAVVSIQRHISCLSGDLIEVGDIPVSLTIAEDQYTILAVTCVLLLCGIEIFESGFSF